MGNKRSPSNQGNPRKGQGPDASSASVDVSSFSLDTSVGNLDPALFSQQDTTPASMPSVFSYDTGQPGSFSGASFEKSYRPSNDDSLDNATQNLKVVASSNKIFPEHRLEFRVLRASLQETQTKLVELQEQQVERGPLGRLLHRRGDLLRNNEISRLKEELAALKEREQDLTDRVRDQYKGPQEFAARKIRDATLERISVPIHKQGRIPTHENLFQSILDFPGEELRKNGSSVKSYGGADTLILNRRNDSGANESVRISYRCDGRVSISYKSANDAEWSSPKSAWNDDAYKIATYFLTTPGSWENVRAVKRREDQHIVEKVRYSPDWKPEGAPVKPLEQPTPKTSSLAPNESLKDTDKEMAEKANQADENPLETPEKRKARLVARWSERTNNADIGREKLRSLVALAEKSVGLMYNLPGDAVRVAESVRFVPRLIDRWSANTIRGVKDSFHSWRARRIHDAGEKLETTFREKFDALSKVDSEVCEKLLRLHSSAREEAKQMWERAREDGVVTAGERKAIELMFQKRMAALNRAVNDAIRNQKWEKIVADIY